MTKTLPKCLERVVDQILIDLDTPRSLTVRLLIQHGEWDQLLNLKADPAQYETAGDYFKSVIATDFLRKCADVPGSNPESRRLKAVEGFYKAERLCKVTNDRFDIHINNGPFEDPSDVRVHDILERVKTVIADILGPLPRELVGRHGPGATYGDKGERTTVPDKMCSRPTATSGSRALLPFWEDTAWCRSLIEFAPNLSDPLAVRGNRFTTVPKDALKDRGICIEPSINIFFQLGVGGVIRQRLRKVGIDLDDGQSKHRRVACAASQTGDLCTIDLSSASDTVSKNLVKHLLPDHWYQLLTTLRSPVTNIDGRDCYLEKFSSMGNGFTFELETLIFLGLAVVATEYSGVKPLIGTNVLVYGDDILAPSAASRGLLAILQYCGFIPNKDKTYIDGNFRESCGGDFFNGVSVRPHYLKEYPHDPASWISLANGIRRLTSQLNRCSDQPFPLRSAWFRALDALPSDIRRLRGPVALGDAVIHDDEEQRWVTKTQHCIRYVKSYVPIQKAIPLERWDPGTQLASALYGVPSTGPIPRLGKGQVQGYRIRWIPHS